MSQHNKSRKQISQTKASKPKLSRWLALGGVVIVTVLVGLIISRNNVLNTQSSTTTQMAGSPRIVVVQDKFDYGDVKLGTSIETVFHIQNVGDGPLTILNNPQVQVVTGCCPPHAVLSSRVILPGQEATITLDFMMHEGMGGKHQFNIDLQTNDPQQPTKQLVVLSNWI